MKNYPFSQSDLMKVRRACVDGTPKNSGNLAYNALRVHRIVRGFRVLYVGQIAGYGKIVNDFKDLKGWFEGKGIPNPNYKWFDQDVTNNVLSVLEEIYTRNRPREKKVQQPKGMTYEGEAQHEMIDRNAQQQLDRQRDWNMRYNDFVNRSKKGVV